MFITVEWERSTKHQHLYTLIYLMGKLRPGDGKKHIKVTELCAPTPEVWPL